AGGNHEGHHKDKKMNMDDDNHWMAPDKDASRPNPITSDKNSISRGQSTYKVNCMSCHGEDAKGDGPAGKNLKPKPANLVLMSGNHSDGDFAWKITTGKGAMPPWKKVLSEKQIWDLVNYIQSLSNSQKQHNDNKHQENHKH
ncbi:MAG: cytochrome c, partial [Thiohalomonadales bacterium]